MASLTPGAVEGLVNEKLTVAGGDRPVLQVVKFATFTNAQGLAREKLWLSDGDAGSTGWRCRKRAASSRPAASYGWSSTFGPICPVRPSWSG